MNPVHALPRWLGGVLLLAALAAPAADVSNVFFYHAEPRDTLIGIGRRLLLEPQRWHQVQALNHIADPRRIPLGSILRIPYEWLRLDLTTATVVAVSGTVQSAGRRLTLGDVLNQGAVVETGADGSVTLDLADGSVITLQKSSVLRLDEMVRVSGAVADSIRLKLDAGRIETKVKPHRDVGRFEIITPVAVSAVRGTEFRDSFDGADRHGNTETLQGTVGVSGDTNAGAASAAPAVAIGAGFGTRVEPGHAPLPPVALLPPPAFVDLPAVNTLAVVAVRLSAVPGAQRYRVQVAPDQSFHTLTADVVTPGSADIPGLADGDYWIRARSIDALGLEGADRVRPLQQHVLPPPPQPASPARSAIVTGTRVHLAWGPSAAARGYDVQVAETPDFAASGVATSRLTDSSFDVDLPPGRYFWRVAAITAGGERGPWSEEQSYTLRPAMETPDVHLLPGGRLAITWNAIVGARYRVQLARDPQFEHVRREETLELPEWFLARPFPGSYSVRVQRIDADGTASPFGAARRFTVPVPLWLKVAAPVAIGLAFLL